MPKSDEAYFLLVAENFLGNISLDGSHQDTSLRMFFDHNPVESCSSNKVLSKKIDARNAVEPCESVDLPTGSNYDHVTYGKVSRGKKSSEDQQEYSSRRAETVETTQDSTLKGSTNLLKRMSQKIMGELKIQSFVRKKFGYRSKMKKLAPLIMPTFSQADQDACELYASKIQSASPSSKVTFFGSPRLKSYDQIETSSAHLSQRYEDHFEASKIIFLSQAQPVAVCSILPHSSHATMVSKRTPNSEGVSPVWHDANFLGPLHLRPIRLREHQEISYAALLFPTQSGNLVTVAGLPGQQNFWAMLKHSPLQYENFASFVESEIQYTDQKHKTRLTLAGVVSTVLAYVEPDESKRAVNESFRLKFPHIKLTYTKYKSLRCEMNRVCEKCDLDPAILTYAYGYFDGLVAYGRVDKVNRKCLAGACLLLAAKMNDLKKIRLHDFAQSLEETFRLEKQDLLDYELAVLVAIQFRLQVHSSLPSF